VASKTILIVDDAAVTLKLLASILRNEGHKVAEHALSNLRTFRPDLVLVDVHLPGIDASSAGGLRGCTVILGCTLLGGYTAMSTVSSIGRQILPARPPESDGFVQPMLSAPPAWR
jgi:ActR/RegA family two-component response regulator